MSIDADSLFVKVYEELAERCKPRDLYENLACARLLRQLLFDANPLDEIVNRETKIKIRYRVCEPPKTPQKEGGPRVITSLQMDGLDPDTCLRANPTILSLNKGRFLKHVTMHNRGIAVSILDFLKYSAYKIGAIHLDNDKEEAFARELDDTVFVNYLRPISRVVLKGLNPLYRLCKARVRRRELAAG